MKHRFEPVDPMRLLGLVALVIGGYLLFTAPLGRAASATAGPVIEHDSRLMAALSWLQPALGEAIVERAVLERRSAKAMSAATSELNRALLRRAQMNVMPMASVEAVREQDAMRHMNHAARVQYVMGRVIVNWTLRGVKSGLMPMSEQGRAYTLRMIGQTEAWGMKMHDEFASSRQASLGTAIVQASQDRTAAAGYLQERLGRAILQVVMTQATARQALAKNQMQLAALMSAVVRTEARADLFARLMELDPVPAPAPVVAMQPVPAPDRAGASLLGLYAGLAGFLLIMTLLVTNQKPEQRAA